MSLKERIDRDLKEALLSGDRLRIDTLRGVKSAILYAEVEQGKKDEGLDEQSITSLLNKEAKKRQESADLYIRGGNSKRAEQELEEKKILEEFLPTPLSENEIKNLVDKAIEEVGNSSPQAMGKIIAKVREYSQGAADGNIIAKIVKERLSK